MTPLFLMKKLYDPQPFHDPPYSEENDIPLNKKMVSNLNLKVHWTTSASSPIFFLQKSPDFYTIRSVYLCFDGMLNLTCNFNFLAAAIFKSLLLKMAATVMTVEFGTIHHYSSLEENSEACLCSSLNRYKN